MKMTGKLLLAAVAVAALSSGAMAADLSMPAQPAPVMAAAPAATNWDGPYIGATVGYGWSTLDPDDPTLPNFNSNGWSLGAQLGYNFHLADQIVAGVQGNIDWTNVYNNPFQNSTWDGAIVARLGVDVNSILPYVEAGVAFANIDDSTGASTRTGWTAGAGVEFMLADQLSANVEYRYSDYGDNGATRATDNSIRLGLNYHF